MTRRERWFGATGRRVPELALEGTIDTTGAIELSLADDDALFREAHARGTPVVVRAESVEEIRAALSRPEVACVLVGDPDLATLDLAELTYG